MKVFISVLALAYASKAYLFKANLHLEEEGTHYDQTEVYYPATGDVITIVPAHERQGLQLEVLKTIENEGLGISVWKLKSANVCHIEQLNENVQPMRFVLKVASFEADNITLSSSLLDTLFILNTDTGPWNGSFDDLTANMKDLCDGYEMRGVTEEAITEEEFNTLMNTGSGRKKRVAPMMLTMASCHDRCGSCLCGHCPKMMYKR